MRRETPRVWSGIGGGGAAATFFSATDFSVADFSVTRSVIAAISSDDNLSDLLLEPPVELLERMTVFAIFSSEDNFSFSFSFSFSSSFFFLTVNFFEVLPNAFLASCSELLRALCVGFLFVTAVFLKELRFLDIFFAAGRGRGVGGFGGTGGLLIVAVFKMGLGDDFLCGFGGSTCECFLVNVVLKAFFAIDGLGGGSGVFCSSISLPFCCAFFFAVVVCFFTFAFPPAAVIALNKPPLPIILLAAGVPFVKRSPFDARAPLGMGGGLAAPLGRTPPLGRIPPLGSVPPLIALNKPPLPIFLLAAGVPFVKGSPFDARAPLGMGGGLAAPLGRTPPLGRAPLAPPLATNVGRGALGAIPPLAGTCFAFGGNGAFGSVFASGVLKRLCPEEVFDSGCFGSAGEVRGGGGNFAADVTFVDVVGAFFASLCRTEGGGGGAVDSLILLFGSEEGVMPGGFIVTAGLAKTPGGGGGGIATTPGGPICLREVMAIPGGPFPLGGGGPDGGGTLNRELFLINFGIEDGFVPVGWCRCKPAFVVLFAICVPFTEDGGASRGDDDSASRGAGGGAMPNGGEGGCVWLDTNVEQRGKK